MTEVTTIVLVAVTGWVIVDEPVTTVVKDTGQVVVVYTVVIVVVSGGGVAVSVSQGVVVVV